MGENLIEVLRFEKKGTTSDSLWDRRRSRSNAPLSNADACPNDSARRVPPSRRVASRREDLLSRSVGLFDLPPGLPAHLFQLQDLVLKFLLPRFQLGDSL